MALWNIKRLKEALEGFLFQLYVNQTHSAMGISPATALSESIEKHGVRDVRKIEYSEEFLALTLIEDRQLMRKILVSRGVKFNNKLFSHKKLNDPKWVGKRVPIRYDPMDNSYIAVLLGAEWVLARRREYEDKYHDVFSREEISAARFFQTKSANDVVESHQAVQSLVNSKEARLREEVKREAEVVVQTELKPSSGLFKKKMDPSSHKPEKF